MLIQRDIRRRIYKKIIISLSLIMETELAADGGWPSAANFTLVTF